MVRNCVNASIIHIWGSERFCNPFSIHIALMTPHYLEGDWIAYYWSVDKLWFLNAYKHYFHYLMRHSIVQSNNIHSEIIIKMGQSISVYSPVEWYCVIMAFTCSSSKSGKRTWSTKVYLSSFFWSWAPSKISLVHSWFVNQPYKSH